MAQTLVMPKLGLTMTEGVIVKWLKKEGDFVAKGEPLFEVETDKLTNTIESNAEGILLKIAVQEGETVPTFTPVAYVGEEGEKIEEVSAPASAETEAASSAPAEAAPAAPAFSSAKPSGKISPAARKLAKDNNIDISLITPERPEKGISLSDVEAFLANPEPLASGLAKKMAAESGVDLGSVQADGRIMSSDVKAHMTASGQVAAEERVPMDAMRKVIARRMSESRQISPEVTFDISVDMTAMKAAKEGFAKDGLKVSYTDLLVSVVSRLLAKHPILNCSVEDETIVYKHYVNMGLAVALPNGLVVPVIKNSHIKGLSEISNEIRDLATAALEGRLSPDNMQGGTFTITNLGMFGIESFTPIINQPEVAILGVNAMKDTVVFVDGEITVKPIMKFSLVADHRAVDGAVAAEFLAKLKQVLEHPASLLL